MRKIYLAIPYTGMEESSYRQANEATAVLLNAGFNVFSPITHSHPLTKLKNYTVPGSWNFWKKIDYQFLDWADDLYVLTPEEGSDKVDNSVGVQEEIKYFRLLCSISSEEKQIKMVTLQDLEKMLTLVTN